MIKDGNSIISFVEFDATDNWETVFKICAGYLTQQSKSRLQKITISSVIVEKQYIDKDYRNTFSKFHSKKFATPKARCIRLHLFSKVIDFSNPAQKTWNDAYSGYIVLRPTLPNSIGRSLLSPKLFTVCKCYLCECTEDVMVNGIEMTIEGFPFISQDTDATVCAQSSLWMLLRYFSNRHKWYKEIYPSELTCLVKSHPQGKSMPGAGLTMIQMADALRDLGFTPLLYDRRQYKSNFLRYAYCYIESGFPLLLGLPGHVVVAVGHISDLAGKGKKSSFDFFKGFIINDDNGLPYARLTKKAKQNQFRHNLKSIDSFLVPLPDRVFISVDQFETLVSKLSDSLLNNGIPVPEFKRFFLTTGRSFKIKALDRYAAIPEVKAFYAQFPLPHFIWVCELSEPELYSEVQQCRGEIIWDATKNVFDSQLGLVIHLPGTLIFDNGAAYNTEENYQKTAVKSLHYSIYKNNLKEI